MTNDAFHEYPRYDEAFPICLVMRFQVLLEFPMPFRHTLPFPRCILVAFMVCFFFPTSFAQVSLTSGSILGNVTDTSSAIMPGVQVSVHHLETGLNRSAITNDSGYYSIPQLPVGTYRVVASLPGFKTAIVENIKLEVNQKARVDFSLEVGEISDQVQVTSTAAMLETDTSTVGEVIDEKQVSDLPLNGRNFLQLALLVPGTVEGEGSRQEDRTGAAVSVNGLRTAENSYSVDGVDANDNLNNFFTLRPNIDAIREFKVLTNLYDAEFGRTAGAQINMATKSGTNRYHGTLFDFHRNSVFNARNFFDTQNQKEPFVYNQFGGTFGFPIVKDKTFGFFEYQGLRSRRGDLRRGFVPTERMRRGDLSEFSKTIKDPLTGTAFPGKTIPAGRLDPVAQRVLAFVPLPSLSATPGNVNFSAFQKVKEDRDQFTLRLDHRLTDSDSVFVRASTWKQNRVLPGVFPTAAIGDSALSTSGEQSFERVVNAAISYTRTLDPKTLNEFRFGYNRNHVDRFTLFSDRNWAKELGIQGPPDTPRDLLFPRFTISGWTTYGSASFLPNLRVVENLQWADTFSLVRANHTVKAGFDIRRVRLDGFFPPNLGGNFNFSGRFSGDGITDFLLGYPDAASVTKVEDYVRDRAIWAAGFAQDDWGVTSKLTLNLGLRWDLFQPPREIRDRKAVFDPIRAKLIRVGTEGIPSGGYRADWNNFGPRIGFAYRPFSRVVLRGGYGIFFSSQTLNTQNNLGRNPPFQVNLTTSSDPARPTLDLATTLAGGTEQLFPTANGVTPDWRDAYTQHFSLLAQYLIQRDLMLEIGYVGTHGVALPLTPNINQPTPASGALQPRRPFPDVFSSILIFSSIGNSVYHSLQTKLEKRLSHGLTYRIGYTFSKALSDGDEFSSGFQNVRDRRYDRGRTVFDARQRFTANFSYALPLGRGRKLGSTWNAPLEAVLGGWQLVGIATMRAGFPFTPTVPGDPANVGGSNRPDRIADGRLAHPTLQQWFDPAAFKVPDRFRFGSSGRNILTGPGLRRLDFALHKNFRILEGHQLQFRAEMFNATNTPKFLNPVSNITVRSAGQITASTGEREIQLALKYIF
ncbi:MAG TPA: TonB-dependent receptor [Acidobacteriota bacterium]|nr:TonB-dependent receptor [Acidobacteriota bacterium]